VQHLEKKLGISERRVCKVICQPRSTQRYEKAIRGDEERLRADIIKLTSRYGRYGYRRITALLHRQGWQVNHKRVERIWRQEGLKVPKRQPKRGRLWLNDGSCVRLRPTHRNHVWAYDFVMDRTHDGRPIKIMTVIDEYSRECLTLVPPVRRIVWFFQSIFPSSIFPSLSSRFAWAILFLLSYSISLILMRFVRSSSLYRLCPPLVFSGVINSENSFCQ